MDTSPTVDWTLNTTCFNEHIRIQYVSEGKDVRCSECVYTVVTLSLYQADECVLRNCLKVQTLNIFM